MEERLKGFFLRVILHSSQAVLSGLLALLPSVSSVFLLFMPLLCFRFTNERTINPSPSPWTILHALSSSSAHHRMIYPPPHTHTHARMHACKLPYVGTNACMQWLP